MLGYRFYTGQNPGEIPNWAGGIGGIVVQIIKIILGLILGLASVVCSIIILVAMFKDEIWKGIVGLLCTLYGLYYALFEFDHEYKWPIVLVALFGSGGAFGLIGL